MTRENHCQYIRDTTSVVKYKFPGVVAFDIHTRDFGHCHISTTTGNESRTIDRKMALTHTVPLMDTQSFSEAELIKHFTYSYIPLRQVRRAASRRPNGRIATESIWLRIIGHLDDSVCLYQKQKTLHSLSLTCRFFNEFATRALYQTLDLQYHGERDSGISECTCSTHKKLAIDSTRPRKRHPLRNKLNRLIRSLRSRPNLPGNILHLKLPHEYPIPKLIEQSSDGDDPNPITAKWFEIFRICSPGLNTVVGLDALLEEFLDRGSLRLDIGYKLWAALERNKKWQEWDFTAWSLAYLPGLDILGFPPPEPPADPGWSIGRLQQTFASWKNLKHVTLRETAWLQGALHSLPKLQSVTINAGAFTNFDNIFQHIPAKNLQSLSYNCEELHAEDFRSKGPGYLTSEPFEPLIKFLEDTNSSPSILPVLKKISINFQWWNDEHKPYSSGMGFRQLISSIFSSVPMLEELNLTLSTYHERIIGTEETNDLVQEFEQQSIANTVLAPNLRSMSLSVPAQTNTEWLARKIASRAFPNLRSFTFQSSLSKGESSECTICTEFEDANSVRDLARGQDQLLISACQEFGVDKWAMRVRNKPNNVCVPMLCTPSYLFKELTLG